MLRLDDPRPSADTPAGTWWPPRMLDPTWVRDHGDSFDLMHIHFGFDAVSPRELDLLVGALRRHGKPLVLTVHDLRNPHHSSAELHDEQLGVLVAAADALITLTPGAAREIEHRWGRRAVVVPHPHVVPEEWITRPRPPHDGFVVGVHAKSLRASMAPAAAVDEILSVLDRVPDAVLRVDAHTDVMSPGGARHDGTLERHLRGLAGAGRVDLRIHDYFTDDELYSYLSALDVSVLPYRFGTHSGWLEACHDLGTTVLAPDCGWYADQRPCVTYRTLGRPARPGSVPSLGEAILAAHAMGTPRRPEPGERIRERDAVARAHEDIYRAVLGCSGAGTERSARETVGGPSGTVSRSAATSW